MLQFRRRLTCFTGIGNPEPKYAGTRHNVGLIFLDLLKNRFDPQQLHPYRTSSIAPAKYCQPSLQLVMIRSDGNYMNLSGKTVVPMWNRLPHRSHVAHVVIHDELSLPLGKVQLRKPGTSLRGHNGLKSIQNCWRNDGFYRLSVGIGRPPQRDSNVVSDYVLSKFNDQELEILQTKSLQAAWERIGHLANK
ncbi:hypothetical protein ZYGR_0AZ02510 [Zygosaccharomyces rouxii]|uniref:Peptidyl-tRNA hydrolase n=1 Tax=Zygosaccharomyces rouxii TaxID=4956 RepID=A0A1Q3AK16_ZYGRO|nr:hypothetical protein ZYGR_0AZ02510 [Zygosaccharomyces rouxii]